MHARLAVREVQKVFGVPPGEVDRLHEASAAPAGAGDFDGDSRLAGVPRSAVDRGAVENHPASGVAFDDAPRHLGIHPCGTVISAWPLARLTPLERATKGIVVTQYDMNAIEALGLIKMDLLGSADSRRCRWRWTTSRKHDRHSRLSCCACTTT